MMTITRRARPVAAIALVTATVAAPIAPAAANGDGGLTLRRDGAKAVPFVIDRAPASADGFDWGDAGIGAAVAGLVLGATSALAARDRPVRRLVHLR
jgi:hypothetical protein